MLKVNSHILESMEQQFPGITRVILVLERTPLPRCRLCGSRNTAAVSPELGPRSRHIALATSKVHLSAGESVPARYFCRDCGEYFD